MKRLFYSLMISCFLLSSFSLKAQTEKVIVDFTRRIDSCLVEYSKSASEIVIRKGINNRKIRIKGKFRDEKKAFKQKIKYYEGGLKKEKIKLKHYVPPEKPVLLLKTIKINDEYFYIRNISYSRYNTVQKVSDERLIDGKIYRKIFYNDDQNKIDRVDIWKFKKY